MSGRGILLDGSALQSPTARERGVGRWISGLATALAGSGHLRRLLLTPALPAPPAAPAGRDDLLAWNTPGALREALGEGPALYVVGSPFEMVIRATDLLPAHVLGDAGLPLAVVLYDLIPLLRRETYLDNPSMSLRYRRRLELIRAADLVLAISEWTRHDGIAHLGLDAARVVTVGTGVDPFFSTAGPGEPAAGTPEGLPGEPFVLTVTADDERKNTETLIRAFAALPGGLRASHRLVVAGALTGDLGERLRAAAGHAGVGERLALTGRIDDGTLRHLYRSATAFVFPSRYEGFGLPVAEAAACGAPVLTSSASSLPEVLDLAEATFAPDDDAALAGLLERVLTDGGWRARLRERGVARARIHRWEGVAERTVAAAGALVPRHSGTLPRQRRRLLLVGPLPPFPSGIATYNGRLLRALARLCHVDVLTPAGSPQPDLSGLLETLHLPTESLGTLVNPAAYDAVIAAIGNNHDHLPSVDALCAHAVVVWLHEIHLPFLEAALRGRPSPQRAAPWSWVAPWLDARGRTFRTPPPAAEPWRGPEPPAPLAPALAERARAVIVNSPHAARLLGEQAGSGHAVAPHVMGFLAVPPRDGARPTSPLVVSMGIVDPVKRPELLIDAHQAVHRATGAHLALVGLVGEEHAEALRSRAERLGIGEAVTVTGRVEDATYEAWLSRASVAVQLRARSNGESSAAVADCLGASLPVISDDPATCAELGGAVVPFAPGGSPADLAATITALLTDTGRADRQRRAASAFAAAHGFEAAAARLLEIVDALPGTVSVP